MFTIFMPSNNVNVIPSNRKTNARDSFWFWLSFRNQKLELVTNKIDLWCDRKMKCCLEPKAPQQIWACHILHRPQTDTRKILLLSGMGSTEESCPAVSTYGCIPPELVVLVELVCYFIRLNDSSIAERTLYSPIFPARFYRPLWSTVPLQYV